MSFDLLVLSPHADDAAFSVGGLIHQAVGAGQRVALWTLFESDAWRGFGGASGRRAEDEAFAARYRLELIEPVLRDAPLREPRYRSGRRLMTWIEDGEPVITELAAALRQVPARRILAPLGVGEHVDHQITHWAVRRLAADGAVVDYYEDIPYALMAEHIPARLSNLGGPRHRAHFADGARAWMQTQIVADVSPLLRRLVAGALARSLRRRHQASAHTFDVRATPIDLEEKLRGIACYASQWPLFYPTLDEWRGRLPTEERLWTITPE